MPRPSLPLRVGVTGHRNIDTDSEPGVRAGVRQAILEILELAGELPVLLVSGAAEGADTIAIDEALKLDIPVEVVLPMPLEDFKNDFSPATLTKLEEILAHNSVEVIELPFQDPQNRDRQYSLLAAEIPKRSHVLLACWDGKASGLPGGTSDVVTRFLALQDEADATKFMEKTLDSGVDGVIWIPTTREGEQAMLASDRKWLASCQGGTSVVRSATIQESVRSMIGDTCRYNLEASTYFDGSTAELSEQVLAATDTLAVENQKMANTMFKASALIAAAMGTTFLYFAKISANTGFLMIYLALFASGIVMFSIAKSKQWFGKYVLYRTTAETIRTSLFMRKANVASSQSIKSALSALGTEKIDGIRWITALSKNLRLLHSSEPDTDGIESLRKNWIEDQVAYFTKKLHQIHKVTHRLHTIRIGVVAYLVVGILVLIFFKKQLAYVELGFGDDVTLKTLLVLSLEILPLWLGIWELYQNKQAHKELAWQYRNQLDCFRSYSARIDATTEYESHQKLVAELGERSLFEFYLWALHRFHREYEPPVPG